MGFENYVCDSLHLYHIYNLNFWSQLGTARPNSLQTLSKCSSKLLPIAFFKERNLKEENNEYYLHYNYNTKFKQAYRKWLLSLGSWTDGLASKHCLLSYVGLLFVLCFGFANNCSSLCCVHKAAIFKDKQIIRKYLNSTESVNWKLWAVLMCVHMHEYR